MMTHTGPHLVPRIQPLFLALLALLAVGGVMAVVSPVLPRTSNCPAGSLPVLGSTPCCPAGYALTQLDANVPAACQPFTCCSGGSCTNDQVICGVLGDLYYGLGSSSQMLGWVSAAASVPNDYCTFYGLTCDPSGSLKVINLSQDSGGASWGCSPGAIFNSAGLRLQGFVPNSTGLFGPSVTDISINQLDPAGPLSWIDNLATGNLTSLTCIEFHSNNQYTGSLPSSFPPNLLKLSIYDASLPRARPTPGPLSPALLGLVLNPDALTSFDVSQVPGGAVDWAELALLPNTTTAIFLTSTPFYSNYPSFWAESPSSSLAFTAGSLPIMSTLTSLTSLVIKNQGSLTGTIPNMFGGMTALTNLDLSYNALTGALPQSAIALCLRINSCSFGGSNNLVLNNVSIVLAALPYSTQSISMTSAQTPWGVSSVVGVMPNLASFTALTNLQLSGLGLSGAIPDMFGGMTALTNLDLSNNALTGTLPPSAISLCSKQGVSCNFGGSNTLSTSNIALPLSMTSFSGFWGISFTTMPDLSSSTSLTSIALGGQGLTGTIPDMFAGMTALTSLDLSGNSLTGPVPKSLFQFCNSLSFAANQNCNSPCSLGGNQLTMDYSALAWLPVSTGGIEINTSPNGLSLNQGCYPGTSMGVSYSGNVPDLRNITSLTWLKMVGLSMTGTIPDMFSRLTSLQSMYVSQLTGCEDSR